MDGGALSWDEKIDLKKAVDTALTNGKGKYLTKGKSGIILKVTVPGSLPFTEVASNRKVRTLIVKVLPLQSMTTSKVQFRGSTESAVHKEFTRQKWLNDACIQKYGFTIFPTPVFFETITYETLASKFSLFRQLLQFWKVVGDGRVGVIYMELVNSRGAVGTMAESRSERAEPLGRRLLIMLAMLGFVHGDFHMGNFFQSGRGFVIGDLGNARQLTRKELEKRDSFLKGRATKKDFIKLLYGLEEPERDFTSQYYHPIPGADDFNQYVLNYQWVRSDDYRLSTKIDDVEIATVKEVRKSLGYSDFTRRKS